MNKNYPVGSKVLIIKSGAYNGVHYKEGEIWTVTEGVREYIYIEKDGKETFVCINPNIPNYGQECKPYIESEITNEYQIY